MPRRTVIAHYPAQRDDIGDLITRRPLPGPSLEQLDPFLFLNHHGPQTYPPGNAGLPFGPHPHRGFETVTFILAGELAHLDSGGHESIIRAGGIQWMTAGSGLLHAELSPQSFKDAGGPLEILQLWVNLPARHKMTTPAYTGLQREQIPQVDSGSTRVAVVSGEYADTAGAIQSLTGVCLLTVEMDAGARIELPAPAGRNLFFYLVSGRATIADQTVHAHHLARFDEQGDSLVVDASEPTTLLYGHADIIGEPMVTYGPFVMNTREEIRQAMADYQAGKFGDVPG